MPTKQAKITRGNLKFKTIKTDVSLIEDKSINRLKKGNLENIILNVSKKLILATPIVVANIIVINKPNIYT